VDVLRLGDTEKVVSEYRGTFPRLGAVEVLCLRRVYDSYGCIFMSEEYAILYVVAVSVQIMIVCSVLWSPSPLRPKEITLKARCDFHLLHTERRTIKLQEVLRCMTVA
jgi:hypothetical protein